MPTSSGHSMPCFKTSQERTSAGAAPPWGAARRGPAFPTPGRARLQVRRITVGRLMLLQGLHSAGGRQASAGFG